MRPDRQTDRQAGGRTDGWMNSGADGQMDGRVGRHRGWTDIREGGPAGLKERDSEISR